MADERDPRDDAESEDASPELVHDDIVKRLLDYQRQLRESGPEGEAPAATATITAEATTSEEIVDLTAAETSDDDDTIELEAEETAEAIDVETTEPLAGAATTADDLSAEVIVLHPETATAEETAAAAASVDATADDAIVETIGEIASTATVTPEAGSTEGAATPSDAAATAPTETSIGSAEDAERIARYERSLGELAERFAFLRQSFQDMAIAADGKLAEIEELLAQTQLDR